MSIVPGGHPRAPSGELPNLPDPGVIDFVCAFANRIMRTETVLELGAADEIRAHRDNGGSFLVLLSHFRRWEPLALAQAAETQEPLGFLKDKTGITGRRGVAEMPVIGPIIIQKAGLHIVDRAIEHPNETLEEKEQRHKRNLKVQAEAAAMYLSAGCNWLIMPEGGSKKEVLVTREGGLIGKLQTALKGSTQTNEPKVVRKSRDPDVLLPVREGFAVTIEALSPEERKRVRLLGIVARYGAPHFASLRPTLYVCRPEEPVDGVRKDWLRQGENILQHGLNSVIEYDAQHGR